MQSWPHREMVRVTLEATYPRPPPLPWARTLQPPSARAELVGLDLYCLPTVVYTIQPLGNPKREGSFPGHIQEASRLCSSCPALHTPIPRP